MVDISGDIGNNTLFGQFTDDKIEGKEGNDLLIHSHYLSGIATGGGIDELMGGEGNDTFQFDARVGGSAVIEDDKGINQIVITGFSTTTASHVLTVTTDALSPESVFLTITRPFGGATVTTTIEIAGVLKDGALDPLATTTKIYVGTATATGGTQGALLVDLATLFGGGGGGGGPTPTNGADTLVGTMFNDTIDGLQGADIIDGLEGNDILIGGTGNFNDTLIGGEGVDEFRFGGATVFGNDIIQELAPIAPEPFGGIISFTDLAVTAEWISVVRSAFDPLAAVVTIRNPTSNAVSGTITIEGFFISPDPLVLDLSGNVTDVVLADGTFVSLAEIIDNTAASGVLLGTNLMESLTGTDLADTIIGMQGNDTLQGLLGFDEYVFSVGDGQDAIVDVTPEVPLPPGEPPFDPAEGGVITLVGVTPSQVRITRTDAGLIITYGLTGADTIRIDGAYTEPVNGLGVYTGTISAIQFATATDPRDPSTFVYTTDALGERVVIDLNGPLLFKGSSLGETLLGTDGNDSIDAGAGADFIQAGVGFNKVNGGSGIDTVILGNETGPAVGETVDLSYTLAAFNAVVTGDLATTSAYYLVENVEGSRGDDYIIASSAANTITGNVGNDTVSYEKMTTSTGGVLATTAAGVTVSLQVDAVNVGGWAAGDILELIENLVGSNGRDTLTGNGGANRLNGGTGNDTLNGLGGDDVLIGGAGQDTFNGGAGNDRAVMTFNFNGTNQNYILVGSYVEVRNASGGLLERINVDVETVEFANGNSQSLTSLIGL